MYKDFVYSELEMLKNIIESKDFNDEEILEFLPTDFSDEEYYEDFKNAQIDLLLLGHRFLRTFYPGEFAIWNTAYGVYVAKVERYRKHLKEEMFPVEQWEHLMKREIAK